jgi:hypothetical protein
MVAFCISFFHHFLYFIKKKKIYRKIQREKLYNLQRKAYFICVLFVFEKTAVSQTTGVRPFIRLFKTAIHHIIKQTPV